MRELFQGLYGMKPKAGKIFLFRGTDRIIKWEGNLELEEIAEWAKAKSKKKRSSMKKDTMNFKWSYDRYL